VNPEYTVTMTFKTDATLTVNHGDLNSTVYDLDDTDELKEAIEMWCAENAMPGTYHQDYSGLRPMICVANPIKIDYQIYDDDVTYLIE
jgi:hypothetical protein